MCLPTTFRGCEKWTYRKRRYQDGAWNHHHSLVLRNELLESQNSQKEDVSATEIPNSLLLTQPHLA